MREQIRTRIEALRKELEAGRAACEKVERQRTYLHETTLRISGAIQVLEELLAEGQPDGQNKCVHGSADLVPENELNVQHTAVEQTHLDENGRGAGTVC
jgi:hypothetical protein